MSQAIRSSENNKPVLSEAQSVVTQLMQQVRQMSLELRPSMLDDLGLLPTLLWHIEKFTTLTKISIDFEHYGLDRVLSPEINTTVYRIVQEALTNVARHAKTKEVKVLIWVDSSNINLKIEDQGRGFSPSKISSSLSTGISGMRERVLLSGGKLNIETIPGTGTCLTAEIPIKQTLKTMKNTGEQ
jgi:signal transduction histidine kinase